MRKDITQIKHRAPGWREGTKHLLMRFMIMPLIIFGSAFIISPAQTFPPAGTDEFLSSATIRIDLSQSGGPILEETVVGRTQIRRSDARDTADGHALIEIEIVSMSLQGSTPIGTIIMRESPIRDSRGQIRQQSAGADFPADSFFDVFVEIDTPFGTLSNLKPIRLQATINQLPPFQTEYTPPALAGVALYLNSRQVGVLTHASYYVGQRPSFSVAPGGPSALAPATIHDVPTIPRILAASLGLSRGDDVDALSYGTDFINYNANIQFSVDERSAGRAGTAVATEASAGEAQADEFRVSPSFPAGGSNVQVLDENGDSAPPFPLLIADDVDALSEAPTSSVDRDGNGVPESAVYFSLAAGSPTLAIIGATPADILVSNGGATPTIFLSRGALGLRAGDDVDALCLTSGNRVILFSLSPGSPTLALLGGGAAALLGGFAAPLSMPPIRYAPASRLGLQRSDNVNALKCSQPEIDNFAHTLAKMTIELPSGTQTVALQGETSISVAITPRGGATQDSDRDGLEEVQTEMVSLNLVGNSPMGPVKVRLRDVRQYPQFGTYGFIEETVNDTPGVLDLPPFGTGTADSFFDVFFEVDLGGQVLHNIQPKRMKATLTHKPPGQDDTYEDHTRTELYDLNDRPAGIYVTDASHTPNPRHIVQDAVPARATLVLNTGLITETIALTGWTTVLHATGLHGAASDWDGDGRDQIPTEIVQMDLQGALIEPTGHITLRLRGANLSPFQPSLGETEELTNTIPGRLDVAPFTQDGMIDSFFDVFTEISLRRDLSVSDANNAPLLHNMVPLRLQGRSNVFPATSANALHSPAGVALVDESDQPTHMRIESLSISFPGDNVLYLPVIGR